MINRKKIFCRKYIKCSLFYYICNIKQTGDMSYKSVKFVIDLLKKNGFVFKSQKGSHMKYVKDGKIVVVPNHGSKGVEKGTYYNILAQAGIEE